MFGCLRASPKKRNKEKEKERKNPKAKNNKKKSSQFESPLLSLSLPFFFLSFSHHSFPLFVAFHGDGCPF
jgi:hypothetical protein